MADTAMKQLRTQLGVTQEQMIRRTRSVSLSTIKNAESGKRVTYDTANQLVEAFNAILAEQSKPQITLDDLGLTLY